MNWTGGRLQRQVKVAKTFQDKQKQHFANIRTTLQNGQHQHNTFVPSFMQDEVHSGSTSRKRSRPSLARQSRLEDYKQVSPVVNRLQSMTPRTSHRPSRPMKQSTIKSSGHRKHGHDHQTTRPGSHDKKPSRTRSSDKTADALNTTRSTGPASDRASTYHPRASEDTPQPSTDTLDQQRRRLLAQSDWLGLDRSRPLQMDFASDRGREKVAKRRKLGDHDRVREQQAQLERPRVPSIGDRYMMRGALQPNEAPDNDSIRIRIGDAALISQTDAASRAQALTLRSTSSDSLLVDDSVSQRVPNTTARSDLRLLSDEASSDARSSGARPTEEQHIDSNGSSSRLSWSASNVKEVEEDMEDTNDDERVTETRGAEPTAGRLQSAVLAIHPAFPALDHPASPSRNIASTQAAVHGSTSTCVSSLTGNLQARDPKLAPSKSNDEDLWRRYMNVYDEGTTQPSTVAPSTTAFTNLRRGEPIKAKDKIKPNEESRVVKANAIWDIPSSVERPRLMVRKEAEQHNLVNDKAVFDQSSKVNPSAVLPKQSSRPEPKPTSKVKPTPQPLPKSKPKLDPDAAWKAFVFGDEDGGSSSSEEIAGRIGSKYDLTHDMPQKAKTQAATAGSSSLLTTSSGMGPPTPRKKTTTAAQQPSSTSSSFPFDRPSSLANASTTGTLLHKRSDAGNMRRKGTYSPPKKLPSGEGGRDDEMIDDIED